MRSLIFVIVAAGCGAPPLAMQPPPPDPCRDVLCVHEPTRRNKADVLFVLDDGPTMAAKLDAFRAALPSFIARLDGAAQLAPVSYHLGVVTGDLGAGPQANAALGCRPGGDGAKLRASADMTGGLRYIDDNQITGTSNVADVATTLAAITDVGTAGCAFRQPLEAGYQALHNNISENAGFLRADALLAVVFVSDADDCSAPRTTDLFDPAATAYGPLVPFRCTQFGVQCNGQPVPPMSIAGLTGCSSYDVSNGGKLTDVTTYIDFFTKPAAQGGVKVDPSDAIVAGLSGPRDPVGVTITSPCADDASIAQCATLNRSCMSTTDPRLFGVPAVRLTQVIASARNNLMTSVCDSDDTKSLRSLADLLLSRTATGCLQQAVANRADGTPDCVVTDVTANPDGTTTTHAVPSCAENGHVMPCWQLVDHVAHYDAEGCATAAPTCTLPPTCQPVTNPLDGSRQLYTVSVDYGGGATPAGTTTQVSCATP